MAIPDRDPAYTNDSTTRTTNVYSRESSSTAWFVGIIVVLALLAIGYLVFSANSTPSTTTVDVNNTPAVTAPADTTITTPAPATDTTPMTQAPAPATDTTPMTSTPAPAASTPAPAETTPAPATPAAPATDATPAPAAQ